MSKKPSILFYDLETSLSLAATFRLGEQRVGHNQLLKGYFSRTRIMTIGYQWSHEKKPVYLNWGKSEADEKAMVIKFLKEVKKADIIIGKNNKRFDDKHLMVQNLWFDLDGMPDFMQKSDDLEKQMRKYFNLQSYALDYFSEQLGLGGKRKMEYGDWADLLNYRMYQLGGRGSAKLVEILTKTPIERIIKKGKKAQVKMDVYCAKDVSDTIKIWNHCVKHFEPKYNMATASGDLVCKNCGSSNIRKNGTRIAGKTTYQNFYCNDHGGYAGKASIKKNGKLGKIG